MRIIANIDVGDIVDSLETQEEAFELIKRIEMAMEDYEFTQRLAKYCISELKKECEGTDEPFNISEVL